MSDEEEEIKEEFEKELKQQRQISNTEQEKEIEPVSYNPELEENPTTRENPAKSVIPGGLAEMVASLRQPIPELKDQMKEHWQSVLELCKDLFLPKSNRGIALAALQMHNFDMKATKTWLVEYRDYSAKHSIRAMSKSELLCLLDTNLMVCPPYLTDNKGRMALFYRANQFVKKVNKVEELVRLFDLFFNVLCLRPYVREKGILLIVDMNGWSFSKNYDSTGSKLGVEACSKRIPFPIAHQIIINAPRTFGGVFSIVKLFASKNFVEKFRFIKSDDSLQLEEFFDKEIRSCIPKEFGGTNTGSFSNEDFKNEYNKEIDDYLCKDSS